MYYYSLIALHDLFSRHKMTIVDFEEIPVHAGSIRVIVKNTLEELNEKVTDKLNDELLSGLSNYDFFKDFSHDALEHILTISTEIDNLIKDGMKIAGYGASGRANMMCNLCKFNKSTISYIVDESPERAGRYIAGTDIPIVPSSHLKDKPVDYIIIFAWNFAKMIIDKLEGNDYMFIVPFPTTQIVKHSNELRDFVGV